MNVSWDRISLSSANLPSSAIVPLRVFAPFWSSSHLRASPVRRVSCRFKYSSVSILTLIVFRLLVLYRCVAANIRVSATLSLFVHFIFIRSINFSCVIQQRSFEVGRILLTLIFMFMLIINLVVRIYFLSIQLLRICWDCCAIAMVVFRGGFPGLTPSKWICSC